MSVCTAPAFHARSPRPPWEIWGSPRYPGRSGHPPLTQPGNLDVSLAQLGDLGVSLAQPGDLGVTVTL